jgi:ketosteroid isomerase-like protein
MIGFLAAILNRRIRDTGRAVKGNSAHRLMTPTESRDIERELMKREEEWLDALRRRDAAALNEILADEFLYTVGQSRFGNKADALADLPELQLDSIVCQLVTAHVYGDIAVMGVCGTMKGSFKQEDYSSDYLESSVWVKREGRWRVAAAHLTRTSK